MESTQYKKIKTIATHTDWSFHIVFCNKRKRKLFMKELNNSEINSLKKLYYEKSITSNNDSNWIIQPIAIEEFKTSHCMLYEYTNAIPLSELSQDKLTLSQFKKISLSIVNSFIGFEQQQQLFQSLDTRYILVNQKDYNISYINYDFFISFYSENLNSQIESVHNTTAIHYFSPEQTGQTNQQLDYRSDLYSVGILFYNLLTNTFPFSGKNSENLIYEILTKPAPLLKKHRPDLPLMLSEIIKKLLQKDKVLRYQSAQGLKNDLEIVFKNISFNASNITFQLGLTDTILTSGLNKQFIGRKEEVKVFQKVLQKSSIGDKQIFCIDAKSGVGKSTYVKEIYFKNLATNSFFITTKIEKAKFSLEYSLLINSTRQLLKDLILTSQDLSKWKTKIKQAELTKSSILLENIPEINWFLDETPKQQESSFTAQKMTHIFYSDLSKIYKIFANEGCPIVLFFDDIQWASKKAISDLLDFYLKFELNFFCMVFSYRTDEFEHNDLLTSKLSSIPSYSSIHLEPLSKNEISEWISSSINMNNETTDEIVNQLYYFAKGNPLLTHNLFSSMVQNKIITYSSQNKEWHYNSTSSASLQLPNDIQVLLASKIKILPSDCLHVLHVASLFGNTFNLNELLYVTKYHFNRINAILKQLIQEGLIAPLNTSYEYANILNELNLLYSEEITFQFVHDHIQHISENLLSKAERKLLNYDIGVYYYKIKNSDSHDSMEKITFNWNQCTDLLSNTEKSLLIRWNHLLSKKALRAGLLLISHQHSYKCFELFSDNHWEDTYSITYSIYLSRAYVEGILFDVDEAIIILDEALKHATSLEDKLNVYFIKTRIFLDRDETWKSTQVGLQALKLASVKIPMEPTKVQIVKEYFLTNLSLTKDNIQHSNSTPKERDAVTEIILTIMIDLISTGFLINKNLAALLILRCVRIILHYGKTNVNSIIWNNYALILIAGFKEFEKGTTFNEKSLNALESISDIKNLANIYLTNGSFISHWNHPFEINIQHLRKAQKYAKDLSINHMLAGSSSLIVAIQFAVGSPLKVVKTEIITQQLFLHTTPMSLSTNYFKELNYWIECLESQTYEIDWNQHEILIFDDTIVYMHYSIRQFAAFLLKEKNQLSHFVFNLIDLENSVSVLPIMPHTIFIQSIALFDLIDYDLSDQQHLSKSQLRKTKNKLKKNIKIIENWANLQKNNFQHMYLLLKAEDARSNNKTNLILSYYDRAIQTSKQYKHLHDEAICCERAALYCFSINNTIAGKSYLEQGFFALEKWGAKNLMAEWKRIYPYLSDPINISTETSSNNTDLPLISEFTQLYTKDFSIDHLLNSACSLLLKNSGATKCTWYNYSNQEIDFIVTKRSNSKVICKDLLAFHLVDPNTENLLNLVSNSRELVQINAEDNALTFDLYSNNSKSIFYLPIIQEEQIAAILSFENNHISSAFKNTDIQRVTMIATQIVHFISQNTIVSNLESIIQNRTDSLIQLNNKLLETNQNIEYSKNNLQNSFKLISHDLRAPLTSVIGFIDLLVDGIVTEPKIIEDYLVRSRDKLFSMNQMIQDLFDLSKLETGTFHMNFETWSAQNLFFDLNSQLLFDVNQTHLNYSSEMELEGELLLSIDLQRIEQVLMNLIQNAVKHTKEGSISFSMVKRDEYVDFIIRDTGSGIDPRHLPFIFDVNYTKSKALSTDSSGIGLAVCKHIIENHNGQLYVDCVQNVGSIFTFSIPYFTP